jgi:integrase/recombinase XerD
MGATANVDRFVDEYVRSHRRKRGEESTRRSAEKYATALRTAYCTAPDCDRDDRHINDTDDCNGRKGWFQWLADTRDKSHAEATSKDVERYLDYLYGLGYSGSIQSTARAAISQYHKKMDMSGDNPVKGVEQSWAFKTDKEQATGEKRVYLSRDDMQALVDNVPTPTLRNELLIKTMYTTGCRVSELVTLEVDRIHPEKERAQVWDEKDESWREVPFKGLSQVYGLWLTRRGDPDSSYLFPSPRGSTEYISTETVRQMVVEAAQNAGIQDDFGTDANGRERHTVTPHTIRHTFAVHAAEKGVPAPHLKEVMGHTKLDVTQIYLEVSGDDAVDVLKTRGPSL